MQKTEAYIIWSWIPLNYAWEKYFNEKLILYITDSQPDFSNYRKGTGISLNMKAVNSLTCLDTNTHWYEDEQLLYLSNYTD